MLGRAGEPPRRLIPLALGLILLVTVVLSAQAALAMVFDGRYRDFPFAPLTGAAVPLLMAVSAIYIVGNESFANWQALWFSAALFALALTLVRAQDARD